MEEKRFFSHAETVEGKKRQGSKTMQIHTDGVREKAFRHFSKYLGFDLQIEEITNLLHDVCQLHDLGKYTSFFQAYLLGGRVDSKKKSHARLGAYAIYEKWRHANPLLAYWGYFLIKNHHASLHWPKDTDKDSLIDEDDYDKKAQLFEEQASTLTNYLDQISSDLNLSGLKQFLIIPEYETFKKLVSKIVKERAEVQDYFLLNYLFSLLIEADKLDASQTEPYSRTKLPKNAVDEALAGRKGPDNSQNRLRTQVRRTVNEALNERDILEYRLFTLTAPTGIGKTLTALDFALKLRDKLPGNPQIITALPFINIIEQTLAEYEKVLEGSGAGILGHYQYADLFRDAEKDDENISENDAEREYSERRMLLNTWQSDIVVTSFVQLLQTLISNRNRMLLKFHHFANAIVIMDEVQNIRLDQAPFIGSMIYYCSRFLNTRFVLMTATKPLIFELAQREIIDKLEPGVTIKESVKELLPDAEGIFRQFHRTRIIPILDSQITSVEEFTEVFGQHWNEKKSCLVVCNKVNRSLEVFDAIKSYLEEKRLENPVFYLSTNVLPADRRGFITQMKEALASTAPKPILVATQVVEAGVDLDFDCGFRDLGPIDAIVQVAGRINRENSEERAGSPLYVFDFGDCADVYGGITTQQAKKALGSNHIEEPDYFHLVDKYFGSVSDTDKADFSESRARFKGVKTLYYTDGLSQKNDKADRNWRIPVCDFTVIEEMSWYVTVFIEKSEEAKEARLAFLQMLGALDKEEKRRLKAQFDQKHKNVFQQHTLPVPKDYAIGLPSLVPDFQDLNILYVSLEEVTHWYEYPDTGFKRTRAKEEIATREKGICL